MRRVAALPSAMATAVVFAVANPLLAQSGAAARKTVAVLSFDNNTGQADYDPLGKGVASMMVSDLSSLQEIQLVERDRAQDLVKEMELQRTKYFDSTTAVKAGRMVGAQYIVVGAFAAVDPKIRIDTRVVRVETGEIVKAAAVTGDKDKFFDLEQELAKRLIDGLGVALSPADEQRLASRQRANRIDALSTVLGFSQALALYDAGDFLGAAERMGPVLRASPNSELLVTSLSEMRRRTADASKEKAKDKVKAGLRGLFKKP